MLLNSSSSFTHLFLITSSNSSLPLFLITFLSLHLFLISYLKLSHIFFISTSSLPHLFLRLSHLFLKYFLFSTPYFSSLPLKFFLSLSSSSSSSLSLLFLKLIYSTSLPFFIHLFLKFFLISPSSLHSHLSFSQTLPQTHFLFSLPQTLLNLFLIYSILFSSLPSQTIHYLFICSFLPHLSLFSSFSLTSSSNSSFPLLFLICSSIPQTLSLLFLKLNLFSLFLSQLSSSLSYLFFKLYFPDHFLICSTFFLISFLNSSTLPHLLISSSSLALLILISFSSFLITSTNSSACTYCGRPVGNDARITIEHLNISCHPECFQCGICSKPMGDFLDNMFLHRGTVHCENCYANVL
uniref:LIM zinc-binding domain-containing protein n=1 Tax=Astyanax mexicanus TaxID=7994 RepID=A0A3B1KF76_ASTMX